MIDVVLQSGGHETKEHNVLSGVPEVGEIIEVLNNHGPIHIYKVKERRFKSAMVDDFMKLPHLWLRVEDMKIGQ